MVRQTRSIGNSVCLLALYWTLLISIVKLRDVWVSFRILLSREFYGMKKPICKLVTTYLL